MDQQNNVWFTSSQYYAAKGGPITNSRSKWDDSRLSIITFFSLSYSTFFFHLLGKFYLGDAWYGLTSKILTTYKNTRHHLKNTPPELQKLQKSCSTIDMPPFAMQLRGHSEFWRKGSQLLQVGMEPHYSYKTITLIILACCILHNFILTFDPDERFIAEVEQQQMGERHLRNQNMIDRLVPQSASMEYSRGKALWDSIARLMW